MLLKKPKQLNGSTAAWVFIDKAKEMSKEATRAGRRAKFSGWGIKRVIRGGKQNLKVGKITHVLSVWGFDVSSAGTASEPVRIRMFL